MRNARRGRALRPLAAGLGVFAILAVPGLVTAPRVTLADSLPSSPSYSFYVSGSWGNYVTFNGQQVLYAYEEGYYANPGASANIVIDFHRQEYSSTYGWGVCEDSCVYYSDTWVKAVAQAFINGYAAGHTATSVIAAGVSNDDYNYACTATSVATAWASAGTAWSQVLNGLVAQYNTDVEAANDIEDWQTGSWNACGAGAENWLYAFTNGTASQDLMQDFGSDGNAENSSAWTVAQVYDVSWGIGLAVPLPEIYCNGQQTEWAGTIRKYGTMVFSGVTSENGSYWGSPCASSTNYYTYTWQQSWDQLESALVSNGFSNDLDSVVTIF